MELEILQENLIKALNKTTKVILSKPQIPILSNVLLTASNEGFKLIGSDMQTTISTVCGAKIKTEGSFTVPARTLFEIVSSLPPEKITLRVKESFLEISCGKFTGKIVGIDASEYPSLTFDAKSVVSWKFEKKVIEQISRYTSFAVSTDDSRAVLTGILLRSSKEGFTCIATDGFRLSFLDINTSQELDKNISLIIPAKAIAEVARLVDEQAQNQFCDFRLSETNQLSISFGDSEIITTMIAGNFPNVDKIIPSESVGKIVVSAEDLQRAVKLSSVFARDNANIIRLKIDSQNSLVNVFSHKTQLGENQYEVAGKIESSQEDLVIAFNYHYVQDFLNSLSEKEEMVIEFSGSTTAAVFKGKEEYYRHIIMPVRVQS